MRIRYKEFGNFSVHAGWMMTKKVLLEISFIQRQSNKLTPGYMKS